MNKVDQLIDTTAKLHVLAKELKESQEYEKCKYHLVIASDHPLQFALYRIGDKASLFYGPYARFRSYQRLHGIASVDIYMAPKVKQLVGLIENPPTKEHDEIS